MSGKHYKGPEVSCCIKYFIFGFNVIFWFLGIAFLGIGLWAWNEKGVLSNISSITDLGGFDPVWLFLVVGGVMFILGFAGCIGALRENTFLLKFFSVFLGIIFFLELTAGVLAFVFKDWIKDQLYFFINNNIRAYRDDIDLQNLIDFTQEYWQCCGAFGADDWNLNIYFNCTDSNASRERCGVPFSCCTKDPAEDVINTQCGYDARQKPEVDQQIVIYTKGCVPQFEKWLQDNLTIVAGIFIGIALLQIFGICLAQNLLFQSQKSIFEHPPEVCSISVGEQGARLTFQLVFVKLKHTEKAGTYSSSSVGIGTLHACTSDVEEDEAEEAAGWRTKGK
ncbi:hypothetical protein JEQ12_017268 [Ovis aries]|uniref:Tetraspanin n=4 Tax=Amniota TaxID=32524 RepID=A0A836A1J2_SHEEP|nr:hypothetical protein JEQ12_017268 [Ovis aries]